MKLFRWTLIRDNELEELERGHRAYMRAVRCQHWFSEWRDLDIIFQYILDPFRTLSRTRDDYREARNNDSVSVKMTE